MFSFSIPNRAQTSRIKCDNKFVPRSDRRASGTPNRGMTSSTRSLTILVVFWSGIGNTKGHFVRKSCITKTYRFPFSVFGSSMMSIPRIWNGRETGMGFRGGFPGLPPPDTNVQSGQLLQYWIQSLYIPSHHQFRANILKSRLPAKCPPKGPPWLFSITVIFR